MEEGEREYGVEEADVGVEGGGGASSYADAADGDAVWDESHLRHACQKSPINSVKEPMVLKRDLLT